MRAFGVFTEKYLRPCDCSGTNFTTLVNCRNRKTGIHNEIVKMQIIEIKSSCDKANISPLLTTHPFVAI